MIPYADLLRRPWSRDGLDPAGPLSCLGVTLVLLGRHGVPGLLGASRIDARSAPDNRPRLEPSAATLEAEAALASWASSSPWETLDPAAAAQDGDVWLLDAEGDPAGVAVVVCAKQGLAVTSLDGRGVVALKVRSLRPRLLRVYRWRGAA